MRISRTTFFSPLGRMAALATAEGICLLEFTLRRTEIDLAGLRKYWGEFEIVDEMNDHLQLLEKELKEYFQGTLKEFTVPLVYPGTDFQVKVWDALRDIPFGTTRSYRQQSLMLRNPGAIRAVGSANGANRIAILIPCHRVIGEDGSLTGYAGGLHRKKWLLDHEGGMKNPQQLGLF